MIFSLVKSVVVIAVFFEVLERLFPIKNMGVSVRSFSKIIMLYMFVKIILEFL